MDWHQYSFVASHREFLEVLQNYFGDIFTLSPGYALAAAVSLCGPAPAQSLTQVHVDLGRWIRPGKGCTAITNILLRSDPPCPIIPHSAHHIVPLHPLQGLPAPVGF